MFDTAFLQQFRAAHALLAILASFSEALGQSAAMT
jgi:hypothetical protein